jgi:hypothetical protein
MSAMLGSTFANQSLSEGMQRLPPRGISEAAVRLIRPTANRKTIMASQAGSGSLSKPVASVVLQAIGT